MHYGLLIDGETVDSEDSLSVDAPATGEEVGTVASGTAAQTAEAIVAAQRMAREWRHSDPDERSEPLETVADRIEDDADEIAELLCRETGKCLATAEGEVAETVAQFRFYAGVTDKVRGDTVPTPSSRFNYTKRVPYGVTSHVVPWNYPLLLGSRSIAAALATGNTVVAKAPSQAPLSTMWYGEYLLEAFPNGVFNLLSGPGSEVGAELSDNDDIDAISFTGSTMVGQHVLESAAKHIIPVDVELGGKAPAIVLPDADPKNAAVGVATGIFSNTGQNCVAQSRLIVHEDIKDEVVDEVVAQAEAITLGDGMDPETDMGAVISADALEDMLNYVEVAKQEGATLLTGGKQPDDPDLADGNFLEPTVFDDVTNDMRIAQEEIFGPVLSIITVSSVEEAIEVANDSDFALAASLWTDSLDATKYADQLDHGLVSVNTFPVSMPQSPWGGNKQSGIGREGGLEGVDAFTTVDSVVVEHGDMGEGYR
ncbi:MAG: aldehyde dehydrogenase [Haloarcula sp.]